MPPRDLSAINAHVARARTIGRDLYEASSITLHMCDGRVITGQSGLLDNIRNDLLSLASEVERASETA